MNYGSLEWEFDVLTTVLYYFVTYKVIHIFSSWSKSVLSTLSTKVPTFLLKLTFSWLQEDLTNSIASLILCFSNVDTSMLFIKVFFKTISREWFGIDRLRLDKFMMVSALSMQLVCRLGLPMFDGHNFLFWLQIVIYSFDLYCIIKLQNGWQPKYVFLYYMIILYDYKWSFESKTLYRCTKKSQITMLCGWPDHNLIT